jgi:hypothetical protein
MPTFFVARAINGLARPVIVAPPAAVAFLFPRRRHALKMVLSTGGRAKKTLVIT